MTMTETYAPSSPVSSEVARRVAEIMARPYRQVITGDPDEGYLATVPDLPGCMTAGETPAEALELLQDAMQAWLESTIERGLLIPEPSTVSTYSGKLLVRMPKSLHRGVIERAEEEGVSANALMVALLSQGLGATMAPKVSRRARRAARRTTSPDVLERTLSG